MSTPVGERDLVYRSCPGGGVIGCGFIAKPDPARVQVEFEADHYSAVLLLAGRGTYQDRPGGSRSLRPGDLVHRVPRQWHRTLPGGDGAWREFFILLPTPVHHGLRAVGVLPGAGPVWHPGLDPRLTAELFALLPAMRAASDDGLGRIALAACAWIGQAARDAAAAMDGDPRLDAARLRLAQDLDRDLDPAALARDLGMSRTAFRRWFRRAAGSAPGAYRLAARLERARTLLAATSLPIPEVARATGFCDRFAFSRAFAAAAGCPPAAFRRRHGG